MRRTLVPILTFVLIVLIVHYSWRDRSSLSESRGQDSRIPRLEEQMFTYQARVTISLLFWIEEHQGNLPPEMLTELRRKVTEGFRQSLADAFHPADPRSENISLLQIRLIVAKFLDLDAEVNRLWERLSAMSGLPNNAQRLNSILERAFALSDPLPVPSPTPLSEDDLRFLDTHLPWYSTLVRAVTTSHAEERALLRRQIATEVEETMTKFSRGIVFVIAFHLVSFLLLGSFLVAAFKGKIRFQYTPPSIPPQLCLEMFALYLAVMLVAGVILEASVESQFFINPVALNIAFLIMLPLLLFWPRVEGYTFREVRDSLGLPYTTLRQALRTLLFAPFVYLGFWGVFVGLLLLYTLILYSAGIDISRGTHPIVPLFFKEDRIQLVLLVLLGVVVAPVVEELFFRGAFYSWLRSWSGPWISMFVSALVFAVIHPQGPLGIVPLTAVGILLAFVREWKRSLLLSMGVHACVNSGTILFLFYLSSSVAEFSLPNVN